MEYNLLTTFTVYKAKMTMKPISIHRTIFLAIGIMVAVLILITTSLFGMNL